MLTLNSVCTSSYSTWKGKSLLWDSNVRPPLAKHPQPLRNLGLVLYWVVNDRTNSKRPNNQVFKHQIDLWNFYKVVDGNFVYRFNIVLFFVWGFLEIRWLFLDFCVHVVLLILIMSFCFLVWRNLNSFGWVVEFLDLF